MYIKKSIETGSGWGTTLIRVCLFLISFSAGCQSSSLQEESSRTPSTTMGTVFENPVEYEAGENPTSIVSGDWDQDGRIDLMVLNPRKQSGSTTVDDGTLTLFIDNASDSGKFPFSSKSLVPYTAVWRQHLVAFDFNADNQTDLVVAAANLDQISLLQNDSGSFSENASISVGDVPVHLETGDWDADNDTDLAVVNRADNSFSILKNSGGIYTLDKTYYIGEGAIPLRIIGGDWDSDGDTDEPVPFDIAGTPRRLDDPQTTDTGVGPAPVVDMGKCPPPATDADEPLGRTGNGNNRVHVLERRGERTRIQQIAHVNLIDVGSDVAGFVTIRVQFRHHCRCVHVDVVGVERVGEEARRTDIGVYVREGVYIACGLASDLVRRAVNVNIGSRD